MGVSRQLYQLQELDRGNETEENALKSRNGQLGESPELIAARDKFTSAQKHLDELNKEQRSTDGDIKDLAAKIGVIDEKLYSGRIRNPKELSDLQTEGNTLKSKRDRIETRSLELMEQVENTEKALPEAGGEFKQAETQWQSQQKQLAVEIEQLNSKLADLKQKRLQLAETIDPDAVKLYEKLRKEKGKALAKIEQGLCLGCHISLSSNEIRQSRSGNVMQCSSCGRILYLP
ncbi:MAG: C4-type zinc ribbon domain-containing protein [Dehalococcoidales bacterium]|nr:C4-type zinc ribbon domain-containing protein [Dehalococcoidales bacterium]